VGVPTLLKDQVYVVEHMHMFCPRKERRTVIGFK
jgi:hypothetical protein